MIVIRIENDLCHICRVKKKETMRNIIVPTDFSKQAQIALEYAIELSKKMLANVHVLHAIEHPAHEHFDTFADGYGGAGMGDVFMLKLIEKSTKDLEELKNKYKEAEIEVHLKMTSTIEYEIISFSKKHNADLIIMGSKGTSSISEEIIGSNTEKVVRNAHCPVLTVKEKGSTSMDNLVFASDFNNVNDKVVEKVKMYQEIFQSKLHLLRVCTPHNFENTRVIEERMLTVAEKHDLNNYELHTYNDFYEEDGIANFTSFHDYDLVCLATNGRTGLSHFFVGSIAEDVINHSYKPVMTFNLKNIDSE